MGTKKLRGSIRGWALKNLIRKVNLTNNNGRVDGKWSLTENSTSEIVGAAKKGGRARTLRSLARKEAIG